MTEQELARVIWNIKEIIRNIYDDAEVEDVILPFTLLRRLDCVLDQHRDYILSEMDKIKDKPEGYRKLKLKSLMDERKLTFFNESGLSLQKLLANPNMIADNFKTYLEGFTDNVKDILSNFVHQDGESPDLTQIYRRLDKNNKLFAVVQTFVREADLDPAKVSNAQMGTVFEIVIRWSKESTNSKAGQYYTPREIVRLLAHLTLHGKEQELQQVGKHFLIYDPCCGTGGMLTAAKELIKEESHRDDIKFTCMVRNSMKRPMQSASPTFLSRAIPRTLTSKYSRATLWPTISSTARSSTLCLQIRHLALTGERTSIPRRLF